MSREDLEKFQKTREEVKEIIKEMEASKIYLEYREKMERELQIKNGHIKLKRKAEINDKTAIKKCELANNTNTNSYDKADKETRINFTEINRKETNIKEILSLFSETDVGLLEEKSREASIFFDPLKKAEMRVRESRFVPTSREYYTFYEEDQYRSISIESKQIGLGNKLKLLKIIEYFHERRGERKSSKRERKKINQGEEKNIKVGEEKNIKVGEEKKQNAVKNVAEDIRFLYYLKKLKIFNNYNNRALTVKYVLDKSKTLRDRCVRNLAECLGSKNYKAVKNEKGVEIESVNEAGKLSICSLQKTDRISYPQLGEYDKAEFEYAVYKFEDNLRLISKYLDFPIQRVILIFYACHFNFRITDTLCAIVSIREWCDEDRKTFEECYKRYGRKFDSYFNFTFRDLKTEIDLKIYFHYYNNKVISATWSEEERSVFMTLFEVFRKDWEMYLNEGILPVKMKLLGHKSEQELKAYYNNYFKKLSEEELFEDLRKYGYSEEMKVIEQSREEYEKLGRRRKKKNTVE
ncbi:hypothetical protein NUSPORA_02314 [Nucleospora cyclopteri]